MSRAWQGGEWYGELHSLETGRPKRNGRHRQGFQNPGIRNGDLKAFQLFQI